MCSESRDRWIYEKYPALVLKGLNVYLYVTWLLEDERKSIVVFSFHVLKVPTAGLHEEMEGGVFQSLASLIGAESTR